ncbi:MAG TPA: DUF488 domain-containing protein [Rhizomicrobium sp.]|nr:DUF488 domain-containing protein [Rhizomicrobium sp.]
MKIRIKRVYEPAKRGDGLRILVDRVWPRGMSKDKAHIDHWVKDVAPGTALRKWFGHEPARWSGFRTKYRKELVANREAVRELSALMKGKTVTLLYGARNTEHNNAVVLAEYLARKTPRKAKAA